MSYDPSAGQGTPPGGYNQPGQYGQPGPYDQQPGQYGQQPGQYGQQPGQYGQQPGQYGQQPGQYGQQPGQYGQPAPPPAPGYGAPGPYPGGGTPYGMPGYGAPVGPKPGAYRGWAIANIVLSIFFCLIAGLPMAIAANYYASKVNLSWDMGDQQGAVTASNRARLWNILSSVLCVIGLIIVIILLANSSSTST